MILALDSTSPRIPIWSIADLFVFKFLCLKKLLEFLESGWFYSNLTDYILSVDLWHVILFDIELAIREDDLAAFAIDYFVLYLLLLTDFTDLLFSRASLGLYPLMLAKVYFFFRASADYWESSRVFASCNICWWLRLLNISSLSLNSAIISSKLVSSFS